MLAGLSDGLDGLLARKLHQQTLLGQYLDPIADKLLMSTMFLVLSILHKIPWKYTVLVLSRDVCILATCMALYATVGFRDFRPSIFGKVNLEFTEEKVGAYVLYAQKGGNQSFCIPESRIVVVGRPTPSARSSSATSDPSCQRPSRRRSPAPISAARR